MLETDFILMMTAGFLLTPETAKEQMLPDFDVAYDLTTLRSPGRVSIGGVSAGEMLPWRSWLEQIRSAGVHAVSVIYIPYEQPGLAPHMAAAFAGVLSFVLLADTGAGQISWFLRAENSRPAAMSAAAFAGFIEAQPMKNVLWDRIHFLINESNGLNNRPLIPRAGIVEFFSSHAGEEIFDFSGDNLLSEIQIECLINGSSLSFAGQWESYFAPPYDAASLFSDKQEKEPVYFYLLREVSATELEQIIAAQSFAGKIRPALNLMLKKEAPQEFGGLTDTDRLLQTARKEQLQTLGNLLCRLIAGYCEENGLLPDIPPSLSSAFGPDETDQRRARARGHTGSFRSLRPLENPWRFYCFEPVFGSALPVANKDKAAIGRDFRETLLAIRRFAEKKELEYFAGRFRLAALFLSPAVSKADFLSECIRLAKENGIPEELEGLLHDSIFYVNKMIDLGWPGEQCFGLLAVALTNVFGGMGSWNDMSFEEREDAETYGKVSAGFFRAREVFFAAMLSVEKRK